MKKWSEYLLLVEVNKNQCGKKNDSLKWINRKKKHGIKSITNWQENKNMVELCLSIRFQFSQIKIEMSSQPVYHVRMQGTSIDVRFPVICNEEVIGRPRQTEWTPPSPPAVLLSCYIRNIYRHRARHSRR